jgi:hypothetical protein
VKIIENTIEQAARKYGQHFSCLISFKNNNLSRQAPSCHFFSETIAVFYHLFSESLTKTWGIYMRDNDY